MGAIVALRDAMLEVHHYHIRERGVQPALFFTEGTMAVFGVGTFGDPKDALVSRKDGYGVRIIPSEFVAQVAGAEGVYVHALKLGRRGVGGDDASMISTIRDTLMHLQCCIVTISGLSSVSDVLFKWCAEFTKSNPWCYVFFDDIDVTLLLPENQSRCVISD
jgi:hypothetical protein